jgi:hypothetical protein
MLSRLFSLPPIKVQTKPVLLRKLVNPWPIRKIHHTRPSLEALPS